MNVGEYCWVKNLTKWYPGVVREVKGGTAEVSYKHTRNDGLVTQKEGRRPILDLRSRNPSLRGLDIPNLDGNQ